MTESEAIKFMKLFRKEWDRNSKTRNAEALDVAIQALETIKKLSDRNMTTEVLENYMQFEDECVKKGFTFKSVIEAREKQIAKKPIAHQCVTCGNALLPFEGNYCSKCGCRLDWSDEE